MSNANQIDPSKTAVVENVFIRVRSIPPKRRRANREFSRTPIDIPTEDLTAEEIEAIQADPMLVVEFGGEVPELDSNEPHNPASERADSSAAEQAPPTEAAKPSPQAPQGPAGKAQPKKTKAAR